MSTPLLARGPWTSADIELFPANGVRYEIINGVLSMSRSPHWHHQAACGNIYAELKNWSQNSGLGKANITPGVLFDEADDVIPDVVWIRPLQSIGSLHADVSAAALRPSIRDLFSWNGLSNERLAALIDDAGHLTGAPELVVEVLSFGERNEQRDRQAKRKLYEMQGVREYWIVDWRLRQIEVYRREQAELRLMGSLLAEDTITSPLLPGFSCPVIRLFT